MHNLKQYIAEIEAKATAPANPEAGTYAKLVPDHKTVVRLEQFCRENGIKCIDGKDFHVTVVYSRKGVPAIADYPIRLPIVTKVSEFDLFPTAKGDQKTLVCRLESTYMHSLFNTFVNEYGAEWDYEEFKPHLTLCYDWKSDTLPNKVPMFPINLTNFEIAELDEDWKAGCE